MTAIGKHPLVGQWRTVEADLWDGGYLDLCGPATITIGADKRGEIAFGAMQATLNCGYSVRWPFFSWAGFAEMDEATSDGSAELLDYGSIEITLPYRNGDEAILMLNGSLLQQPASALSSRQQLRFLTIPIRQTIRNHLAT